MERASGLLISARLVVQQLALRPVPKARPRFDGIRRNVQKLGVGNLPAVRTLS